MTDAHDMRTADRPRTATVVITTKNRKDDLRIAIASSLKQEPGVEVLVVDDGSTDGTSEMMRTEFPAARLIRHEQSRGYIVRRNEGAREASGDVVVSIDDDAAFTTPGIIADCLASFTDERVGAVAIPYIDVNKDGLLKQHASDEDLHVTARYIGTAHAVRRDLFLRLGGYREALVHQGEESDFCLRMLDAGFVVALGRGAPIHHFESPKRDFSRMDYYGARNAVLFELQNVPLSALPLRLPITLAQLVVWTLEPRRLWTRLKGIGAAIGAMRSIERSPVSLESYRLFRALHSSSHHTLPY